MKLLHVERAEIPRAKIVDYLLSLSHPDGRGKAGFFLSYGFTTDQWTQLADALRRHATDHEVNKVESTPFGTRHVVEGDLHAADGRRPMVRSVWFIEQNEADPRFVTTYPLPRRELTS